MFVDIRILRVSALSYFSFRSHVCCTEYNTCIVSPCTFKDEANSQKKGQSEWLNDSNKQTVIQRINCHRNFFTKCRPLRNRHTNLIRKSKKNYVIEFVYSKFRC